MTESTLKQRITEDMKQAMRDQQKDRLTTIRLLLAAIKQVEVDQRITLDDAAVIQVLGKMLKQRRDSITQFEAGGRADLAAKENAEIEVLSHYMPSPLSDAELTDLVAAAIDEVKPTSIKDMGKVMAYLKPKVEGRADMTVLSQKIKEQLGGN